MKHIFTGLAAATLLLSLHSCNMKEMTPNDTNNEKLKETVFKNYPTVNYIGVKVNEDRENIMVTLGDKELFGADAAKQQQVADEIGQTVAPLYEPNNYLKKGTVKFVAIETEIPADNEPGKEYDMHLPPSK